MRFIRLFLLFLPREGGKGRDVLFFFFFQLFIAFCYLIPYLFLKISGKGLDFGVLHSALILLMYGSVMKEGKGVDILASLCNMHNTSEDELRETMEKANNLIADILKKTPRPASECRGENMENIDTGY